MIPDWRELTDEQRFQLENMASTFGIDMTIVREMASENLALPTVAEAHSIAAEMYMMSRRIILQAGEK